MKCQAGAVAVNCFIGPVPQVICEIDQTIAAAHCLEVGGTWAPAKVCPAEADETTGEDGNQVWDPALGVTYDHDADEYIVDPLTFEELKLDPAPLFATDTQLRQLQDGYFAVAQTGALSEALGWEAGDVLLALGGYDLGGLSEFSTAYTNLADAQLFELTIQRGRDQLVLRYRVE